MQLRLRTTPIRRILGTALALAGASSILLAASTGPQRQAGFLWIAESNGALNVATDSSEVRFEIPRLGGFSGLAVNDVNGELWAYGGKELRSFSRTGAPRLAVPTDPATHGGDPADLVADGMAGNLWMAVKRDLYRFDLAGALQQTLALPDEIVALSLDRARSRLWVASRRDLRAYDADGGLERTVEILSAMAASVPGVKPGSAAVMPPGIQGLAYDPAHDQVWLTLPDKIRRYGNDGAIAFERAGSYGGPIAVDGAGGAWLQQGRTATHLNETAEPEVTIEPFAGQPDKHIVDLVADPGDASVWLASQRTVRHYAIDGVLLDEVRPELGDGLIRRLARAALYADLDAPEIRFAAPAGGSLLNSSRPVLELEYFDLGVGVQSSSIGLLAGEQTLAMACDATAVAARCVPIAALPEGRNELSATIADEVGNVSRPAVVTFEVDTVPPEIVILEPALDAFTNQPSLLVRGRVSEPAAVTIGGSAAAVSPALEFATHVSLREGPNTIAIGAVDRAGNRNDVALAVTLDTRPPATPDEMAIDVGDVTVGEAIVAGAAGAVEAGSSVRITNGRTGQTVTVVAAADGSFRAIVAAQGDDELTIVSIDRAGNASGASIEKVPAGLAVLIDEPLDAAVIQTPSVMIAGTVRGTLNTGVTVNGEPATLLVEGGLLRFYRAVPLQMGANTIAVTATLADGGALTRSITVSRQQPTFELRFSGLGGMAPYAASFEVAGSSGGAAMRIDYDFDGNGTIDASRTSLFFSQASFVYRSAGIYRPRVLIHRRNSSGVFELVQQYGLTLAILSTAQLHEALDPVLRSVWDGLVAALVRGDLDRARLALSIDSRPHYRDVFELLAPRMAEISNELSRIEPVTMADTHAEYAVLSLHGGDPRVHLIGFIRDATGVWRIDSM